MRRQFQMSTNGKQSKLTPQPASPRQICVSVGAVSGYAFLGLSRQDGALSKQRGGGWVGSTAPHKQDGGVVVRTLVPR